MKYVRLLLGIVLIGIGAFVILNPVQNIETLEDVQINENDIFFAAPDGVRLVGSYYPSSDKVVILVHQYNGNRRQWDNLVPVLLENNYSVFAYDIRGFGDSDGRTELDKMYMDVAGAVEWLKANTNYSSIGIIGASVGANIAFESSSFLEINTSIAMSPADRLLGDELPNFKPNNILFMSDIDEREAAQALYGPTIPPKDLKIYGNTAHGIQLLQNPQAVNDIQLLC